MVKEERLRWYVIRIVGEQPVRADIVDWSERGKKKGWDDMKSWSETSQYAGVSEWFEVGGCTKKVAGCDW
jgi:hypothetical protein